MENNLRKKQFIENYNKGLNDTEISKILKLNPETIRQLRIKLGLVKNFKYSDKIKIDKKELELLILKNLKDVEIANILNVNKSTVRSSRIRYNIERDSFIFNKPLDFNKEQLNILTGCLLGDGSLRINKNSVNPRFSCEHGYKQKEYCRWKFTYFKNCSTIRDNVRKTIDKRNGKYYSSTIFTINSNSSLLNLYNNLYKDGIKIISKEFLENYNDLSLAVHFMDDGYKTSSSIELATNCFQKEELEMFINFLYNKFGLKFTITKRNTLYLKAKYYVLFESIVKKYIHPTLLYKLQGVS